MDNTLMGLRPQHAAGHAAARYHHLPLGIHGRQYQGQLPEPPQPAAVHPRRVRNHGREGDGHGHDPYREHHHPQGRRGQGALRLEGRQRRHRHRDQTPGRQSGAGDLHRKHRGVDARPDELQPLQRLGEARGRAHRGRLHLGESPDAGGSHQTLQRTQSAGARRTGHLLARKTPAHGRRPQTHPLGRTGRQPQAAGDDRLLVQQRGGRDEGFGAHGALGRRERFVPQEKLPVPQHIERQQHQERQLAVGRFRGLRPDESLLERRRSPDGPDRPLGLRRSGQPDVRRHARNARPRDLHQRDGQLLRRMAGHRGAETHRPPRHRRKAQRRRRILSGQAFEIRHLGLRKHEHAAAQRLLPARQRQEQRHFGRNLRQLRQKLGQTLPLRQRRRPDRRKHVQRLPALRRGIPQQPTADITFARQYAQDKKPVGISSITREISFLGTASYSYDDRYNVDLTFRESASSLYGGPTTAGRRHGAPAWRGTSTTNPSCAIRTF